MLLIFDLDGTLVDSERLNSQALLDVLPGVDEPVDGLAARYRGRKLSGIFADLEARHGVRIPEDLATTYRRRVAELYETALRPMDGVAEVLGRLDGPRCVASSAPREKIEHALAVTDLRGFFGEELFSSYEIGSWKPEPDIFLHAAARMDALPGECVVVDDSEVGVEAALRAGMRVVRLVAGAWDSESAATLSIESMRHLGEALERI